MKGTERDKWLELASLKIQYPESGLASASINCQSLCHFCSYASWGSCCSPDLDCTHSLEAVAERSIETVWPDCADCWGFRPDIYWDDAVEFTSQRMQGIFPGYPAKQWRKENPDKE